MSSKAQKHGNGRGTVWEVKKGSWRWQATLGYKPDGKRITASGRATSKTKAQAALTKALADHARGLLATPNNVTLIEYAQTWLSRQTQLRANTRGLYGVELGYALELIGHLKIRDVRPGSLKDVLVKLRGRVMLGQGGTPGTGRTMSDRTLAKVTTRLRAVFREATADQLISVDPMHSVRKARAPSPEAVATVLDFHEATRFQELGKTLYEAGLCRLWPALFTAISVGLRRGEVMGLSWADVDLNAGVLHVRQQLTVRGATNKPSLEPLKTKHSRRDIPMPKSLLTALQEQRARVAAERAVLGLAWAENSPVFPTAEGTWTHPDTLKRSLANVIGWSDPSSFERRNRSAWGFVPQAAMAHLEAVVRAGEKLPDLTPYDLRHTFATLALRSRVPVEVVSRVLGHARVSITLDVYRTVAAAELREHTIDLFDAPAPVRVTAPRMPN